MAKNNYETHRFFCICCGNEGIPLMRKQGHKHTDFHRKKLYCPHCKMEVNHIECKSQEDVDKFKEAFRKGEFQEEAQESLNFINEC